MHAKAQHFVVHRQLGVKMLKICSRLSSVLSVMVEIGMLLPKKPGFMELCANHLTCCVGTRWRSCMGLMFQCDSKQGLIQA
jgi:hypothetical protein